MRSEFADTMLSSLLTFANGRSRPNRADGLPFPIYGSNGIIGYANETNADANTIVIGRVGSYCGSLYFSKRRCWVTDNAIRATARGGNDPQFLFYLLTTLGLNHWRAGSGQPLLNQEILSRVPARVPQPREQRAIGQILGTLDDKIALNLRMNETLETTARGIFETSFREAKATTAPSGWSLGKLGDVLSIIETGGRPKGGVRDATEGVPSVGAESIVGIGHFDYSKTKFVSREFFNKMNKGHVRNGDVLLYKDGGRPGEFEPHVTMVGDGFPFPELSINEHVYRLRSEPSLPQSFLFFWLSSEGTMDEMRNRGTGVAIPGLNSTAVRELPVLLPPAPVLRAFDGRVSPLIDRIFANCNEARTLAAVRDALLPKLLSGEIRLKPQTESSQEISHA